MENEIEVNGAKYVRKDPVPIAVRDHAWVRHVPTDVLREIVWWWDGDFIVVCLDVRMEPVQHPDNCDGTLHPDDWTRAVCAELRRREREGETP